MVAFGVGGQRKSNLVFHHGGLFVLSTLVMLGVDSTISAVFVTCRRRFLLAQGSFGGVLLWFPGHVRGHHKLILGFHRSGLFALSTSVMLGVVSTISIMLIRCCCHFLAADSTHFETMGVLRTGHTQN